VGLVLGTISVFSRLDDFNRDNTPDVKPVGGNQSIAVLKNMNDLGEQHEQIIRESLPNVDVLLNARTSLPGL
jgi:hypothetical protein